MGSCDDLILSLKQAGVLYVAINPDNWLIPRCPEIYSIVASRVLESMHRNNEQDSLLSPISCFSFENIQDALESASNEFYDWSSILASNFFLAENEASIVSIAHEINTVTTKLLRSSSFEIKEKFYLSDETKSFIRKLSSYFILVATPNVPSALSRILLESLGIHGYFHQISGAEKSISFVQREEIDRTVTDVYYASRACEAFWNVALSRVTTNLNLKELAIMDFSSDSYFMLEDPEVKLGGFISLDPLFKRHTNSVRDSLNLWKIEHYLADLFFTQLS